MIPIYTRARGVLSCRRRLLGAAIAVLALTSVVMPEVSLAGTGGTEFNGAYTTC